jgi:hypothetical protein
MYMYGGVLRQIPPCVFDRTGVRLVTLRGYVVTLRVPTDRDPTPTHSDHKLPPGKLPMGNYLDVPPIVLGDGWACCGCLGIFWGVA